MKLFKTSNMEVVKYCQSAFNFVIPSVQIAQKSEKFVKKNLTLYISVVYDDSLYQLICAVR